MRSRCGDMGVAPVHRRKEDRKDHKTDQELGFCPVSVPRFA